MQWEIKYTNEFGAWQDALVARRIYAYCKWALRRAPGATEKKGLDLNGQEICRPRDEDVDGLACAASGHEHQFRFIFLS